MSLPGVARGAISCVDGAHPSIDHSLYSNESGRSAALVDFHAAAHNPPAGNGSLVGRTPFLIVYRR